ncbi:MAG: response regulator [Elusimicrobiales bacterium]|nr:response regulator [Elusimicrobiales bacterium]
MRAARILIVGGEPELSELCVGVLEKENARHVLMSIDQEHSDRVLSIAEAFKPDLILLLATNHLAPLGGAEVCRQLRANAVTGGAKIILFSSDGLKKGLRAARACGADAFIRKPFEPEKLVEMVELLLS